MDFSGQNFETFSKNLPFFPLACGLTLQDRLGSLSSNYMDRKEYVASSVLRWSGTASALFDRSVIR